LKAAAEAEKAAAGAAHAASELGHQAAALVRKAEDAGEAGLAHLQDSLVEKGAPASAGDVEAGGKDKGLQAVTQASAGARTTFTVWAILAGGLYIAALILLILGTVRVRVYMRRQCSLWVFPKLVVCCINLLPCFLVAAAICEQQRGLLHFGT
jgi:hypothetical protein